MSYAKYNISDADRALVASMANAIPAPALVIQTSSCGDMGEDSFVREYRDLVYAKNVHAGLHRKDSVMRHIAYRNLPYEGTMADYQSFVDGLKVANPFADCFFGVDVIDMSGWAGRRFFGTGWTKLKWHLHDNPFTDFVFIMKAGGESSADLREALQRDCGIPVEKIVLDDPTPEMLASFVGSRINLSGDQINHLAGWIECASRDCGSPFNFSWAKRFAAKIAMERPAVASGMLV